MQSGAANASGVSSLRGAVRIMKHLLAVAALLLFACTSRAQTQMDKSPFECAATVQSPIQTPFSMFGCSGIFYDSGDIEVSFSGGSGFEISSKSGGWLANGTLTSTSFTQPTPYACVYHFYQGAGCPAGSTPGTFAFTWTATDANNVVHTGSMSGTWFNLQYCGGRCWYHPTLETAPLTVN